MSPELAQSAIIVEGATRGQGAVARVSWESVAETDEPDSVDVYFDGLRLAADDPRLIQLPEFDPHQTHHLRVRLEFTEYLFSETEAVFGGVYGSEVSTEISAVPVWFDKGRQPESAQSMRNWFTVGGAPQSVHAIEKGLAEIVVVRDLATQPRLQKLAERAARVDTDIRLEKHHRDSFVNPCPEVHPRDGYRQIVYPLTQRYSSKEGTLLRLLAGVVPANCTEQEQQLADAVAIAGLAASGDGLRRVVLLLLSSKPLDQSDFTPAQVISYLGKLRVPLVVWSLGSSEGLAAKWGQVTDVHKLRRLNKAFNLVEKNLEHQLIVWLEGLHLPQSVELSPEVEDISLVQ